MKNLDGQTYSNFRDARLVQLLKVEVNEGDGTKDDPIERVCYIVDPESGNVLAKIGSSQERMFPNGGDQMHQLCTSKPL